MRTATNQAEAKASREHQRRPVLCKVGIPSHLKKQGIVRFMNDRVWNKSSEHEQHSRMTGTTRATKSSRYAGGIYSGRMKTTAAMWVSSQEAVRSSGASGIKLGIVQSSRCQNERSAVMCILIFTLYIRLHSSPGRQPPISSNTRLREVGNLEAPGQGIYVRAGCVFIGP